MNNERCSNIFLVKFALNEIEGGSDKSSKSNYLKASLQKECISLCQSSILQVIFGDGLLSSSSNKRCSHFKSAFYLFCPHKFLALHLQIFVQRKGVRFVLKTTPNFPLLELSAVLSKHNLLKYIYWVFWELWMGAEKEN